MPSFGTFFFAFLQSCIAFCICFVFSPQLVVEKEEKHGHLVPISIPEESPPPPPEDEMKPLLEEPKQ